MMRWQVGASCRSATCIGPFRWLVLGSTALAVALASMASVAGERPPELQGMSARLEPLSEELKEGLAHAMAMTPYAVVVVHTRLTIESIPDKSAQIKLRPGELPVVTEERHIYEARVLETLRGQQMKRVRYEIVVDGGDGAELSTRPEIVMLCRGPRGFYGGGVGASFDASRETVALARSVAKDLALKPAGKFGYCD